MRSFRSRSYVGIDPSITSTGIAIITHLDEKTVSRQTCLLKTPPEWDETIRLQYLRNTAKDFIRHFGWLPIIGSAIEGPSLYSVNQKDKLGGVRGVLRVLLADLGEEPPAVIPPSSLKKFFTGKGDAKKDRMIAAAEIKWGSLSEDEADAAGLAEFAQALYDPPPALTRKQLEAIHGIREMSQSKPKPPTGGRELNI